jgi:hypothetical protein
MNIFHYFCKGYVYHNLLSGALTLLQTRLKITLRVLKQGYINFYTRLKQKLDPRHVTLRAKEGKKFH